MPIPRSLFGSHVRVTAVQALVLRLASPIAGGGELRVTVDEPRLEYEESTPKPNHGTFGHRLRLPVDLRVDLGRLDVQPPVDQPGRFFDTGEIIVPSRLPGTAFGDFDGDGDEDVYVAAPDQVHEILLNDGDGFFPDSTTVAGGPIDSATPLVADLEGDGDPDVVSWVSRSDSAFDVMVNTGGALAFVQRVSIGRRAHGLALGDVDGDGDVDAVAAIGYDSVSRHNVVYLNQFDSSGVHRFVDSRQLLGDKTTYGVALGDLDGDGDLDAFFNSVPLQQVWWNDRGLFTLSEQQLPPPRFSRGMKIGDVDADGDLDVLAAGFPVRLWRNDGSGILAREDLVGVAAFTIEALVDLDDDGFVDGLFADGVWLNDGSGHFQATGEQLEPEAVGDADGDGLPDALHQTSDGYLLFLNGLGVGRWTWIQDEPHGAAQTTVTLIAQDDDGRVEEVRWDIDVANSPPLVLAAMDQEIGEATTIRLGAFADVAADAPWRVEVDWGDGTTLSFDTFKAGDLGSREHAYAQPGWYEVNVTVREEGVPSALDSDMIRVRSGSEPAIVANSPRVVFDEGRRAVQGGEFRDLDPERLTLRASNGRVQREALTLSYRPTGQQPNGQIAAAMDVDGDLDTDLVTVGARTRVWFNRGDGGLEPSDWAQPGGNVSVDTGDFDGDGDVDLVVHTWNRIVRVFYNDGGGRFIGGIQQVFQSGGALRTGSVAGDFDGDGDLDVFVTSRKNSQWTTPPFDTVLLNRGGGVFVEKPQSLGTSESWGAAAGDLDGDGDLDVVAANRSTQFIYMNQGDALFSRELVIGSRSSRAVALGDLDGDGDLDAFFGGESAHGVALNDGTGSLISTEQILGTGPATGVALGDVDADGDLDAWVAGPTPERVWLNDGGATYHSARLALKQEARGIALADFDGDGALDAFETGRANRMLLSRSTEHWFWAGPAADGPADSRPVTITAFDGAAPAAKTRFDLVVNNVKPRVQVVPLPQGSCDVPRTIRFEVSDPSAADTQAGFWIRFEVGNFSTLLPPQRGGSYEVDVPAEALGYGMTFARTYVTDKDGATGFAGKSISSYCYAPAGSPNGADSGEKR